MKNIIIFLLLCFFRMNNLSGVSQDEFQLFLKEYYSSEEKTQKDYSKLLYAIENNYKDIAIMLLEKGEDPHLFSKANASPFLLAIFNEDQEIVYKMIQCGANVNLEGQVGTNIGNEIQHAWSSKISPLQLSVISNKNKEITHILCLNGANVIDEKTGSYFNSALGVAIRIADWEKFQVLIDYFNHDIQQIFFPDYSFLTMCGSDFPKSERQFDDAAKIGQYLVNYNVPMQTKISSALSTAASRGNIELMKILIQNGANINFAPSNGQFQHMPIFAVLEYYKTIEKVKKLEKFKNFNSFYFKEALEILLENGVVTNFSSVNKTYHISPLGYALDKHINEAIELFISYGANPNYVDTDGKTALIRGIEVNNIEGVSLLLNLGANPREKGRGNQYPIDIAFQKGNLDILDLLIQAESLWYTNE